MDDLLALDGGSSATKWQKRHAKRKATEARKKVATQLREERRADLKRRTQKWRAKWKKEAKRRKLLGLPPPSKHGRPRDIPLAHTNLVDMTGWRFGRLTVLRMAPTSRQGSQRCRVWWVKCDCGSPERMVNGTTLRQGNSKSCGCLVRERVVNHFAKRREEQMRLRAAPLSIQIAELRHRVVKKKRIVRRDTALLDAVRQILVQEEVRLGIRRCGKSGRPMLVHPARVKGAHGGRPRRITIH
jgi:hypothetical protein